MNKQIRTASELLDDFSLSISVELQRLSYFDMLFRAIKENSDNSHLVRRFASLGEHLAQDFTHYSKQDLKYLETEQGADDE